MEADVRALLEAPNYVHLSTLRANGTPRNWVVWAGLEGDAVLPDRVCFVIEIEKARATTLSFVHAPA